MPKIIVQKNTEIIRSFNLPSKEQITIGCSSGCDVPIEDPAIAPELAKLVLLEDGFHLQLIAHIPPVFVADERVERDVKLEDGDTIRIEDYNLVLNVLAGEIPVKEEPAPAPPAPVQKPEPAPTPQPVPEKAEEVMMPEPEKMAEPPVVEKPKPQPEIKPEPPKPPEPKPAPPVVEKPDVAYMKTEEIRLEPEFMEAAPKEPQEKAAAPQPPQAQPVPIAEPEIPVEELQSEPVGVIPPESAPAPQPEESHKTKVLPVSEQMSSAEPPARPQKDADIYLLALSGPLKGEKFKLKKGLTLIGRDRNQNDIVIREDASGEIDKSISRKHAEIDFEKGRYLLADRASQMRTKLNGKTLATNDTPAISVGDIIEICSIKESTVFRVASEGSFDFSALGKAGVIPFKIDKKLMPYILIGGAIVVVIIILMFILK